MKKLILVALLGGAIAGAFFAFRWFRGDTAYEDAVRDFEEEPVTPAAEGA